MFKKKKNIQRKGIRYNLTSNHRKYTERNTEIQCSTKDKGMHFRKMKRIGTETETDRDRKKSTKVGCTYNFSKRK